MKRVLITGSNRGIGLAFVKHYLAAGARVFAACRRPTVAEELQNIQAQYVNSLEIISLDVSDASSIDAAYGKISTQVDGLDLLINNAAVFHETPFGQLSFETSLNTLRINAVAPVMVTQTFWDLLKRGQQATVVSISSNRASVSEKVDAKLYDYSASKAALNMYTRSIAAQAKTEGMQAVMIDPGWVQTRMGGMEAALTPAETVAGMVTLIDSLTPEQNGGFFNWDGSIHAW